MAATANEVTISDFAPAEQLAITNSRVDGLEARITILKLVFLKLQLHHSALTSTLVLLMMIQVLMIVMTTLEQVTTSQLV